MIRIKNKSPSHGDHFSYVNLFNQNEIFKTYNLKYFVFT